MSYHLNALKKVPKIIGVGKNYIKHVKEMGGEALPKEPVLFSKPWSSIAYNPTSVVLTLANEHKIDH